MRKEVLVDEQVDMLVRQMPDGQIRPTSFLWRDRNRYVADLGRQWEERVEGITWRCFLVQSVDNNAFELRWNPATDTWAVHRAWLQDMMV